jgi:hypothetical protein
MINVKNKTCAHEGCNKQPCYGIENGLAEFCATHKKDGMIDVNNKKCAHEKCNKQPNYGVENGLAEFCATHKRDGMIDVKNKMCKTNLCYTIANSKYRGYCLRCFVYTFPNEPISRNNKTKEQAVYEFLNKEFNDKTILHDKRIPDGCSKRRPDIFFDFGSHIVIVEIDENQHADYDSTCELARLNELSTDCGFRPIIMIRFNPDKYITCDGVVIPSCWATNGHGILAVPKTRKAMWENRLQTLCDCIAYFSQEHVALGGDILRIGKLFYN